MASTDPSGAPKRLLLIDGSALFYRCYYAFIRNPLRTKKGEATSISYGIIQTLLPILAARRPDKVAIVFDTSAPTFRHRVYPEYKAHRPPVPGDMISQLPRAREVIRLLGIPIVEQDGVEADDLIGSLAVIDRSSRLSSTPSYSYVIWPAGSFFCTLIRAAAPRRASPVFMRDILP